MFGEGRRKSATRIHDLRSPYGVARTAWRRRTAISISGCSTFAWKARLTRCQPRRLSAEGRPACSAPSHYVHSAMRQRYWTATPAPGPRRRPHAGIDRAGQPRLDPAAAKDHRAVQRGRARSGLHRTRRPAGVRGPARRRYAGAGRCDSAVIGNLRFPRFLGGLRPFAGWLRLHGEEVGLDGVPGGFVLVGG